MKILVICQYYDPEPFRISDICEELVKRGHEVTVVTGTPNYPMGEIYPGYRHGKKRDENIHGVNVHRCVTIGRRHGAVGRFANYYSYMLASSIYVKKLKGDFDIVLVNQLSPVIMAKAGIVYKKKHGKKLVLYCLDLWPESLVAGGIERGSIIYKHYHKVSEKIYKQADKILATSKSFAQYFENEFGIDGNSIGYLPQYAESLFSPEMCTKKPNDTVDLMFAGNVGKAQSVETIIKAANLTKDIDNLRWHIVGDGSELENCKALAEGLNLKAVIFHGRKPVEDMPKYYAMADAMLITMQDDPILSRTLPGKVQTYMAAGKPIIGAINDEAQAVINESNCGFCVNAEDYSGLVAVVRDFCKNSNQYRFGENSYLYYSNVFSKCTAINMLERNFM